MLTDRIKPDRRSGEKTATHTERLRQTKGTTSGTHFPPAESYRYQHCL